MSLREGLPKNCLYQSRESRIGACEDGHKVFFSFTPSTEQGPWQGNKEVTNLKLGQRATDFVVDTNTGELPPLYSLLLLHSGQESDGFDGLLSF